MATHWLYQWIDEFDVKDAQDAQRKASLPKPVERLHEIAASTPNWRSSEAPEGRAIVAGTTIDFSGRLNCSHAQCLSKQVDRLFRNIWHYFDSVVVEGPGADWYVDTIENGTRKGLPDFAWSLGNDVEFLLNLRSMGIVDHLEFKTKAHRFCDHHRSVHANEAGIEHFYDSEFRAHWVDRLKKAGRFTVSDAPNGWHYSITYPDSPEPFSGFYFPKRRKGQPKKPTKRQIAEMVLARSTDALVCDVATSKNMLLPLAVELPFLQERSQVAHERDRESAIALELPLPVMNGMPVQDIILLRKDLRPHFERFQYALTLAIREQVQRDPERADPQLARLVFEEFIRPAFADIDRSLHETRRSLSVKAGSALTVGTAVASTGLITSVPLIIGAGLTAAVGITLTSAHKYIDDRKDVKSSDVYFLWKALQGSDS